MRKCEILPGTKIELLLDLTQNRMGNWEGTLSVWVALSEKWNTPTAWIPLGLECPQSHHKQNLQPPLLHCSTNVLLPAQAAHSLCQTSPSLFSSFGSLTWGWATLVLCLSSGRGPEAENSTLAEVLVNVLVDPAQPHPGREFWRAGLLGSQGGNKSYRWSVGLNLALSH